LVSTLPKNSYSARKKLQPFSSQNQYGCKRQQNAIIIGVFERVFEIEKEEIVRFYAQEKVNIS
jgi:hypothetical protein